MLSGKKKLNLIFHYILYPELALYYTMANLKLVYRIYFHGDLDIRKV